MTDSEVINWSDALDQCGDDEEFLRELLDDLKDEVMTQVEKIMELFETSTKGKYQKIMRAAHVIKGAAANLMCEPLRSASKELEHSASLGYEKEEKDETVDDDLKEKVKTKYDDWIKAVDDFNAFLIKLDGGDDDGGKEENDKDD